MARRLLDIFRDKYHHAKSRCTCKNDKEYHAYGGRWIKLLRETFEDFKKDMRESYLENVKKYWIKDTTIDRIDVNGNYCKENCRRCSRSDQMKNRRQTIPLDYKWQHFACLKDLAHHTWIWEACLRDRLKKWRSVEDAVETWLLKTKKKIEYKGVVYESIEDACRKLWLNVITIRTRLNRWWSIDKTFGTPINHLYSNKSKCIHSTM